MKNFKVGDEVVTLIGAGHTHEFGYAPSMPRKAGTVGKVTNVFPASKDRTSVAVKFDGHPTPWQYAPSELEHVRGKGSLYDSVIIHGDEIQTQVSLQNENASLRQQVKIMLSERDTLSARVAELNKKIDRKQSYVSQNEAKLQAWDVLRA